MSTSLATHKTCRVCKQELELDKFIVDKRNKDGHGARCKPCTYATKTYSPERQKRYKNRALYNLEPEQYQALHEQQNYCCKICKKKFDELYVDHCHTTGKVRGLLCHNCNVGLGHLKDNVEYLTNAIEYVQEHGTTPYKNYAV